MDTKEAYKQILISIHALCEEGDADTTDKSKQRMEFLSTPSARRATKSSKRNDGSVLISIHALCEEGDVSASTSGAAALNFYPRPLRGGRLSVLGRASDLLLFLSTPSARRAT